MTNYDFKVLSWDEFERLTRDLLQRELGLRLETFKSGRDGGVDLRCYQGGKESEQLIVQCKHYPNAVFPRLYAELKKEVDKVGKIRPARYVIATSADLSPDNKAKIVALFQPYCLGPSDVYSCGDLNNLLSLYPNIERDNFKLWI
ncbi:MAG: restriction endonuclease, partial [Armatimonadota bacterium]|nr:restriction endonuclease [Armatimonadota bacterium]